MSLGVLILETVYRAISSPFFAWCTVALTGTPYSRARIAAINHRREVLL